MAIFKIKNKGSIVNVEVLIEAADPHRLNRKPVSVVVDDVLDYLTANGIEVASCLEQQTLSNRGSDPKLSGIFSFQKKKNISADKVSKPKEEADLDKVSETIADNISIGESPSPEIDDKADTIESTENTEEAEKPKRQYTKRKKVYSEYSQQ
tara:strand:- start:4720 stop:5175 length:456 start_codon:yes stop_codon:yes gene_type:complete